MSLTKKLKQAAGVSDVTIHVQPADPIEGAMQEYDSMGQTFRAVCNERNEWKRRAEWAMTQLETARHLLHQKTQELDHVRIRYENQLRANGEIATGVNTMVSLGNNIRNTLLTVEHLNAQLPAQPQPKNGKDEEPVDLDAALIQSAPEPTLEEIEQLKRYGPEPR